MSVALPTPGQTVGPFFRYGVEFDAWNELAPPGRAGAIRVHGVVRDGAGTPVPDALLEIWQADAAGAIPAESGSFHRDGSTFTGWGRTHTTDAGEYEFFTLEPAAPFIAVAVFARGLMDVLHTRLYLPGATDAFLESLTPAERTTLVAERTADGLRLDITLQGDGETVFLAYR
ncbi:MAG: protocatechuate 4,5-dioxygenase subunit alpha [Microbacteriaceae bacterium]|jgi:protocatechuate 3,4-dioxygenase alpha subunit|nr:protocatechuate 4,5-dioxygenase subunit alpha [Microbacteriaceae bacterium]